MSGVPEAIRMDLDKAKTLEWWTLGWIGSIGVVMYLAMGASQAMKTAFLEDLLGMIPAVTFLVAAHLEPRTPTKRYPFGFRRVNSLSFLASAVVLAFMGAFLLFENAMSLAKGEHPTIGPVTLFGSTFWLGWVMIAALLYSVVPPIILGRLKKPVAQRLQDKVLHTDAQMQKADWQTGLAGIAGVLGIGFGLWWADSLAAVLIAFSILFDGIRSLRSASAELLDGAPRRLSGSGIAEDAVQLQDRLETLYPDAQVRIREAGRYIIANVHGASDPDPSQARDLLAKALSWRLAELNFSPADPPQG